MSKNDKSSIDSAQLEDTYVNLSQQGASLIHHVSTPLAIARVNVDFLQRYLDALLAHYQQADSNGNKPAIPEEHIKAMSLAPKLINEQLDAIQSRVKDHWQSMNREVVGQVPNFQISLSGDAEVLDKLVDNSLPAKILLVEDEQIHRDIALKILSPRYEIETVSSGEDALEHCQKHDYDLILMDMYLPGINGQEAAKQIRATANQHAIILGLTNMPLGSQHEHDSINAYLSKPLTLKALNSCLEKIQSLSKK